MTERFEDQLSRYFEDAFEQISIDENVVLKNPAEMITVLPEEPGRKLIAAFDFTPLNAVITPTKAICEPGTAGECWKEQKKINGKTVWVWVCDCHEI